MKNVNASPRADGVKNNGVPFYDRSSCLACVFVAALCLLLAFVCVTIVSKCSFIYAFHDGNDVNWFLTVGHGIADGLVPYKDLFEQKGVLLYMLFALNYAICGTQLYVIYVIEVLCGAAFLYISYKILRLWLTYRGAVAGTVLAAAVYFTCRAFWCGGGEAEEYCLPLIAYGVYVFLKAAASGKGVTYAQSAICGACAACIFWVKYSMLAFYAAFAVCVFVEYCLRRKPGGGFACAGAFIGAFAAVGLPWVIYLCVNGAFGDMLRVYIGINLFGYAGDGGLVQKIVGFFGALLEVVLNPFLYLFVIFGVVYALSAAFPSGAEGRRCKIYYIVILVFTFIVQCIVLGDIGYYHLVMAAFMPLGIAGGAYCLPRLCAGVAALFNGRRHKGVKIADRYAAALDSMQARSAAAFARVKSVVGGGIRVRVLAVVFAVMAGLCLIFGNNTLDLLNSRSYYPQFAAAQAIKNSPNPQGSLLSYKIFDRGFYTALDQTPEFYYFAQNLISRESYPELYGGQESYVINGEADFVVTEERYWREEHAEGKPLAKYEYVMSLKYDYIRNNLDHNRLELCLLALGREYGGTGGDIL